MWITFLAAKDVDGLVHGTVPGMAKDSGLTLAEATEAIRILESPDPYSSTPDHEGRRILKVDGGWRITNHGKYRDEIQKIRADNAARQREFRKRQKDQLKKDYPPHKNSPQARERLATQVNYNDPPPQGIDHFREQPINEPKL